MKRRYSLIEHLVFPIIPFVSILAGFVIVSTVFADQSPADAATIDWLKLSMGLFGGLALFLAGREVLPEGLKLAAGNTLRTVLQKLARDST